MPGRISITEAAVKLKLLKTKHQVKKKMVCRIMRRRVRSTHAVKEHNAAHPYNTVKSPGFDKENEDG